MPFANDEELKHSARKPVEKQSQLFVEMLMIMYISLLM
jgi:hypothetical protein